MISNQISTQISPGNSTASSPSISVEDIVQRIFLSKQITRLDQQLLQSIFLSQSTFNPKDYQQINRVFDALRQGMIQVVD